MLRRLTMLCGLLLIFQLAAKAQSPALADIRTGKKIMDGFMDLRFGMFIHWGPVTLKGTEIGWSRGAEVPVEEYDSLYKRFDPVHFDATAWVKAAKDAGMKYLTITAKHHDGFCLWPSDYTTYDIASTPFRKDVVGALAKACREQGVKFCIYYSVLDWHHPDYPIHNPVNTHNTNDSILDPKADMKKYIVYMKNQLKELITRYHPYMLWFDGDWEIPWTNDEAVDMYRYIKSIDRQVIINNRLGADDNHGVLDDRSVGDYATPEQVIGTINMKDPWESCITICRQWAWKPHDKLKSLKECMGILAGTAGGNGNLLLNISPMPDGRIETRQTERLKEIGAWMKKYGAAIYKTQGGPYKPNRHFTSTRRGNKVNILLLQRPDGALSLASIPGCKVQKAYFMGGAPVKYSQDEKGIHLTLPSSLPDKNCSVIVLEMDKDVANVPLID